MDIQTLIKRLEVSGGTLTITTNTFPGESGFAEWLEKYFSSPYYASGTGSITLTNAANGSTTETSVEIHGTIEYMNVSMPASLFFSLTGSASEQELQVVAKFTLPVEEWSFPVSFPNLPVSDDFTSPLTSAPRVSQLSSLRFKEAYFYVSDHSIQDDVWGLVLSEGQNFVGDLIISDGSLRFYSWFLNPEDKILLSGPILHEKYVGPVPPIASGVYPWDLDSPVPGILLQAQRVSSKEILNWKLSDAVFHIYSPVDAVWLWKNSTYEPQLAFSARIPIEKPTVPNPASMTVTSEVLPGIEELLLSASFSNLNLGKLDDLLHLIGKNDLTVAKNLPADLGKAISNMENVLKKISLKEAAVDLMFSPESIHLNYFFGTIAIVNPGPNGTRKPIWEPVKGISIEEVDMTFIVMDPFEKSRSLSVTLVGEIDVAGVPIIFQTDFPDFYMQAELGSRQTIHFREFVSHYTPVSYEIPSVTIDTLIFNCIPGQYYVISTTIDQDTTWDFHIGTKTLSISNIELSVGYNVEHDNGAGIWGTFSGALQFAGNTLDMSLEAPGPLDVRIELPEINLVKLISEIADDKLNFIHDFDLSLEKSLIRLQKTKEDISFDLTTTFSGFADFAFSVLHNTNGNGFAFGINMTSTEISKISKNWGFIQDILDVFDITDIGFVFSTLNDPGYTFPEVIDYTNPAKKPGKIRTSAAFSLQKGLTLFGQVDFSSKNLKHQPAVLLAKLGLDRIKVELDFTLQVDYGNDTFKAYMNIPEFIMGNPANLVKLNGSLGIITGEDGAEFFLTGDLTATFDKKQIKASAVVDFNPDGFIISGDYKGTFSIGHVQFSNLGLAIGVDDAGIPSFGFTTEIDSPNFDSSIALFIDSDTPTNSFFAGTISNITMYNILEEIVGADIKLIPFADIMKEISISGPDAPFLLSNEIDVKTALEKRDFATLAKAFPENHPISSDAGKNFLVTNIAGERWTLTDLSSEWKTHYEILNGTHGFTANQEAEVYVAPIGGTFGDPNGSNGITFSRGVYVGAKLTFLNFSAIVRASFEPGVGINLEANCTPIRLFHIGRTYFFSITDYTGKTGPSISLATYTQKNSEGKVTVNPHFDFSGRVKLGDMEAKALMHAENGRLDFRFDVKVGVNHFDVAAYYNNHDDFKFEINSFLHILIVSRVSIELIVQVDNGELDISFSGWFTFITLKKNYFRGGLSISLELFEKHLPQAVTKIITKMIFHFKQIQQEPFFMDVSYLERTSTFASLIASKQSDTEILMRIYQLHAEEISRLVKSNEDASDRVAVMMLEEEEYVFHVDLILEIIDSIIDQASPELIAELQASHKILENRRGQRFVDFF